MKSSHKPEVYWWPTYLSLEVTGLRFTSLRSSWGLEVRFKLCLISQVCAPEPLLESLLLMARLLLGPDKRRAFLKVGNRRFVICHHGREKQLEPILPVNGTSLELYLRGTVCVAAPECCCRSAGSLIGSKDAASSSVPADSPPESAPIPVATTELTAPPTPLKSSHSTPWTLGTDSCAAP